VRNVKIRPNNLQFIAASASTDYEYGDYITEEGWDIDVEVLPEENDDEPPKQDAPEGN